MSELRWEAWAAILAFIITLGYTLYPGPYLRGVHYRQLFDGCVHLHRAAAVCAGDIGLCAKGLARFEEPKGSLKLSIWGEKDILLEIEDDPQ